MNEQAGQADGVVPLCLPPQSDARIVAQEVFDYLHDRLPALDLAASWAAADSYVEAHRSWKNTPDPAAVARSGPPVADFPPLESCGQCRVDPGLRRSEIHEKEPWLCADCLQRYHERYRSPGLRDGAVPVGAELDLLTRLGLGHSQVSADFAELAALGDEHSNGNHLATVFVDGNGIGALFDRVIASGDPDAKARMSRAVSEATREALYEATAAVCEGQVGAKVPVIPHVVGGDDVLVSVVADRAWRFVASYLRAFSRLLAADSTVRPFVTSGDDEETGASAGVVFAHSAFPFRRAVELADEAKDAAKRAYEGRLPALLWLDVTREGEQPPMHRQGWTLRDLERHDEAIRALRGVPPAGRSVLERLVDIDDPALSSARIHEYARRLDRGAVIEPFLEDGVAAGRIADALALARWWR
ncbi:Cas10/Cmr2 second palm domain-containing protein [Phytohabitans aurantiacus]|uniref:Cas10/Cmr2 second palm domain-containing protein n=1 Tax=Phytohabitans aurantiacus TaxID=3016789 RepID=UPI002490C2A5|nr:hypothetical protein [Phytohabitans aurantiacus]